MIHLADALGVADVEEQFRVATVRLLMVDHGRAWIVPVSVDQQTSAALAGVEVSGERLTPDPVRTMPAFVAKSSKKSVQSQPEDRVCAFPRPQTHPIEDLRLS